MIKLTPNLLLAAMLLAAAPNTQAEELPTGGELTCEGPVTIADTAQTLLDRFPGVAEITDLPGAEGETLKGVSLFAGTPEKHLNVYFFDEELEEISTLMPAPEATAWNIYGLTIGMTLNEVVQANGKDFSLTGFGWDYGGYVTDFKEGKLYEPAKNCIVGLRFEPTAEDDIPMQLLGEGEIDSADPAVQALNPKLVSISLGWVAPEYQQ